MKLWILRVRLVLAMMTKKEKTSNYLVIVTSMLVIASVLLFMTIESMCKLVPSDNIIIILNLGYFLDLSLR